MRRQPYFDEAIAKTDSVVKATRTNDYVSTFCKEYQKLDPQADFSILFKDQVKRGENLSQVEATLKQEVKDRVSSSTNVLRNRIDQFGVVAPNIQELENDGQILLELPGVKEHDRVRDLLKASANLEFYETYNVADLQMPCRSSTTSSAPTALQPPTTASSASSCSPDRYHRRICPR